MAVLVVPHGLLAALAGEQEPGEVREVKLKSLNQAYNVTRTVKVKHFIPIKTTIFLQKKVLFCLNKPVW